MTSTKPSAERRRKLARRRLSGYLLFLAPFLVIAASFWWWADRFTARYVRLAVLCILLVTYFASAAMFDFFLRRSSWRRGDWEKHGSIATKRFAKMRRMVTRSWLYGYLLFFTPFFVIAVTFWWANRFTAHYVRLAVLCILLVTYFASAAMFGFSLRRLRWRRVRSLQSRMMERAREKQQSISTKNLLWAIVLYLFFFVPVGAGYWWADKILTLFTPQTREFFLKYNRFAVVITFLIAYLLGLAIRDVARYRFRMFAAPLILVAVLLLTLIIMLVVPEGTPRVKDVMEIVKQHPWVLVFALGVLMWSPQIGSLLSRVKKASLPGGPTLEIGQIEEVQKSLNPWRKTITQFPDLVQWVADLIVETAPDDVARILTYTPALGFLTRPEGEWRRLHKLLLRRHNIQLICLQSEDLSKWHKRFKGKRTERPEREIGEELIDRANRISEEIIADKRKQVDTRMKHVIERRWDEMPGYYLFANSKRAIIAAPLFLPSDPNKPATQSKADDYLGDTPVAMLGFESTDNWTVWLVNQVCERYANLPESSAFGEASCIVKFKDVEEWIDDSSSTLMSQLRAQFQNYTKARRASVKAFPPKGDLPVELILRAIISEKSIPDGAT
ncbi:MAG TPA: hypothetical protein DC047_06600 [Blastocatellia bacterium]|nr:hypothetical protein [Blastocatellia bacterium]